MENRKPEPDCAACWKRESCARAQEGSFCAAWQSRPGQPEGENPNERWRRGEDLYDA